MRKLLVSLLFVSLLVAGFAPVQEAKIIVQPSQLPGAEGAVAEANEPVSLSSPPTIDPQAALVKVGSPVRINFPIRQNSKTLRIRLVANDIEWNSLTQQVNELRNWFYSQSDGRLILNIDVVHTAFQNIPFVPYVTDGNPSPPYLGIESGWYHSNITSQAKNYDLVIFLVNANDWPDQAAAGWKTDHDQGPIELQLRASEGERSFSQGYPMSAFVDFARHEIVHGLFFMSGQTDLTHQYYYSGQFDQVLQQIDFSRIRPAKTGRPQGR